MIGTILEWSRWWTLQGWDPSLPFEENQSISVCNALSGFSVVVFLLNAPLFFFFDNIASSLSVLLTGSLYVLPTVLNRMGHYNTARILLLFLSNMTGFCYSIVFGKESFIHLSFLVWMLYPLLIVYGKNRLLASLSSLGSFFLLCVLLLFVFPYYEALYPLGYRMNRILEVALLLTTFLIVLFSVLFFRRSMLRSREVMIQSLEEQQLLEISKNAAEQASKAKSEFMAIMSHELRTPLNAILGYSELLMECSDDNPEVYEDVRSIYFAGRQLLDLINDVLDLSKIESGKFQVSLESFSLRTLLKDVEITVHPLVEKNRNTLTMCLTGEDVIMFSDSLRLRQCLLNLLSNAAKFTHDGSIQCLCSTFEEEGVLFVVFDVIDSGIGIEPDKIESLFQKFVQVDNTTTRRYGGTGLGLTITRHLIEQLGGEISVQSQLGEGSTFSLRVPARLSAL